MTLVVAEFKSPRYGTIKVEGVTVKGVDSKTITVGSWNVNSEARPARALQTLLIVAKKGMHDRDIVPGSESPEHFGN